ncbi:hypothetical protein VIBRN418_04418 [Vibrio sp. N418]|uniref:hypothetical protein n=1 Tax=Vibrio sp. (strain N418) TaxID=701176 RepID=UPI00021BF359|nr:hypothetical protein [Vibrio sp. N418]EGU37527.1 hypothetical protein VIBRN418_04418 [Vibrio sp. N418]
MIKPDIEQLRIAMKLPSSVSFYGWLIHNPKCGDFLHSFKEGQLTTETFWAATPDKGFEFEQFEHALETYQLLQLQSKAIIVAAFNLGEQFMIADPADTGDASYRSLDQTQVSKRRLH